MSTRPTIVDGYEVEPYAASEVEIGWRLVIRGYGLYEVQDCRTMPARREGEDPQRVIMVNRPPFKFKDEAGMTVYKVIKKAEVQE